MRDENAQPWFYNNYQDIQVGKDHRIRIQMEFLPCDEPTLFSLNLMYPMDEIYLTLFSITILHFTFAIDWLTGLTPEESIALEDEDDDEDDGPDNAVRAG